MGATVDPEEAAVATPVATLRPPTTCRRAVTMGRDVAMAAWT